MELRAELYRLEELVAWLRGEVAAGRGDEEYVWQDPVKCLMGRYLADRGSGWGYRAYSELPAYEVVAGERPWNLAAALERGEKVLALPAPVAEAVAAPVAAIERAPLLIEGEVSH
jgi:hypothetical protein